MMKTFCVFCVALLFSLLVGLPSLAVSTSVSPSHLETENSAFGDGPQWRRTVDGWERADLWETTLAAKRQAAATEPRPIPHPLLIALLQLAASLSALAAWPYRAGNEPSAKAQHDAPSLAN